MLSSREAYKAAVSGLVQSFDKGGRSTGPVIRPSITATTAVEVASTSITAMNANTSKEILSQAIISSQRQTIDNYQKDRDADRAKIEMLSAKLAKAEDLARSREDYNELRQQCDQGYQAGIKIGEKNVSHSIVTSRIETFTFCFRF